MDQMGRAYQTALNLIGKTRKLSRHRALRYDGGDKLADTYNRFLERIGQELEGCHVQPGEVIESEEAPSLEEFIEGS